MSTLEALVLVEEAVYFAQGKKGGGWITNRSHLAETVAFEIHTQPQEDRGAAEVRMIQLEEEDGDRDTGMGYKSDAMDSGISTRGSIIVSCPQRRKHDPGLASVFRKYPNRITNFPEIKGFYSATISFGKGEQGEQKMRAALNAIQEPWGEDGKYQASGVCAGQASEHYQGAGESAILVYNDTPEPELVYNVIGGISMVGIWEGVVTLQHGELPYKLIGEQLTTANDHCIRKGLRPPFLYLLPNAAGPAWELIDRERWPNDPPPGGGFLLLEGVSPLISEPTRSRLLLSMGVKTKGTWAWVRQAGTLLPSGGGGEYGSLRRLEQPHQRCDHLSRAKADGGHGGAGRRGGV